MVACVPRCVCVCGGVRPLGFAAGRSARAANAYGGVKWQWRNDDACLVQLPLPCRHGFFCGKRGARARNRLSRRCQRLAVPVAAVVNRAAIPLRDNRERRRRSMCVARPQRRHHVAVDRVRALPQRPNLGSRTAAASVVCQPRRRRKRSLVPAGARRWRCAAGVGERRGLGATVRQRPAKRAPGKVRQQGAGAR